MEDFTIIRIIHKTVKSHIKNSIIEYMFKNVLKAAKIGHCNRKFTSKSSKATQNMQTLHSR